MNADQIIDAVMKASYASIQEDLRLRELERLRENSRRKCGGCFYWMKSRQCPKERNVNGWNRGPSMNGAICSKFEPTVTHLAWVAQYETAKAA